MKHYEKEPESCVKIRFADCDPFNHLNNSRYIDYMIHAREDQLLECYGFDPYELARTEGLGWVAAQTQVAYLSPAFPLEIVKVTTRLLSVTTKTLLLEARMYNQDKTMLKALMWTTLVHFNIRSGKSQPHRSELLDFLQQVEHPLEMPAGFEDRVAALRPQLKQQA